MCLSRHTHKPQFRSGLHCAALHIRLYNPHLGWDRFPSFGAVEASLAGGSERSSRGTALWLELLQPQRTEVRRTMELLGRDRNRKPVLLCVCGPSCSISARWRAKMCMYVCIGVRIYQLLLQSNELPVSDGVSLPKQLDFSFETDEQLARGSRSAWDPVEQGQ